MIAPTAVKRSNWNNAGVKDKTCGGLLVVARWIYSIEALRPKRRGLDLTLT